MSDTMNSKKMWSGRFLLCLCAAVAIFAFTVVLGYRLALTDDEKLLAIALNMISMTVSSVITFYFTKSALQGGGQ